MTALFLLYNHMGKLRRNNLKQAVSLYSAALQLSLLSSSIWNIIIVSTKTAEQISLKRYPLKEAKKLAEGS